MQVYIIQTKGKKNPDHFKAREAFTGMLSPERLLEEK